MAQKNKRGMIIYYDMISTLEKLKEKDPLQAIELVISMLCYSLDGSTPYDLGDLNPMFWVLQGQIDRDNEKYKAIVDERARVGRIGGIASGKTRKAKASTEANEANASHEAIASIEANEANASKNILLRDEADTDTDTDTDTVTDTDTDTHTDTDTVPPSADGSGVCAAVSPRRVVDDYNSICPMLPEAEVTQERKAAIRDMVAAGYDLPKLQRLFMTVAASSFLTGGGASGWRASFDWIMQPKNAQKILEGNFSDRSGDGGKSGRPKTRFHNFQERGTDYDALIYGMLGK